MPIGPINLSGLKALGSSKLAGSFMIAAMFKTNKEPVGNEKSAKFVGCIVLWSRVAGATEECL